METAKEDNTANYFHKRKISHYQYPLLEMLKGNIKSFISLFLPMSVTFVYVLGKTLNYYYVKFLLNICQSDCVMALCVFVKDAYVAVVAIFNVTRPYNNLLEMCIPLSENFNNICPVFN